MQEQAIRSLIRATHSECHVCKSTTHALHIRLNKAPHLVILTGSQNLRPVLGKPRRSSTGLKKPRANMSLVQGSKNPRFTLGEPFFLLSSISTGTQGTQVLPLVHTLAKPKVYPRYALLQNPRHLFGSLTRSNYNNHHQGSKFNKTNYHQTMWQDLQLGTTHTYSS